MAAILESRTWDGRFPEGLVLLVVVVVVTGAELLPSSSSLSSVASLASASALGRRSSQLHACE